MPPASPAVGPNPQPPPQGIERLATLVHLERRARGAGTLAELGFVLVNETIGLVAYRQAVLLGRARRGREILAMSGIPEPASDAPFPVWIRAVLRHLDADPEPKCRAVTAADLPAALAADWGAWLPAFLIVVPLRRQGLAFGVLALAREDPPTGADLRILGMAGDSFAHCWEALAQGRRLKPRQMRPLRRRLAIAGLALAAGAAGFVPVPSAVLAPAEIVPAEPAVVRSALDGVVDRVLVRPSQTVAAGEVLVQLDPRRLQAQLQAAQIAAAATEAEFRQVRQSAVTDPRARAQVPGLQGRLDQQLGEVRFLETQETRLEIRAPRAGIALFDNAYEWIGRPVAIGERIMLVADPAAVELEIRVPATDAIRFGDGAAVLFFSNVDPQRPAEARLRFAGYRALPGPDGIVAYRLKARFLEPGDTLRIGLKGTAKVYGPTVALGYYVLRRPLAVARVALGL